MSATLPPDALGVPPHALGYHALKLWQRGLDLAADAHRLARAFPDADQPALAADLRRAAASVPATIAAGALAFDAPGQQHALHGTAAALARVETLAALAERLGALSTADATALLFTAGDVNRLLRGFVRSVSARTAAPHRPAPGTAPTSAANSALAVAERPASAQDAAPAGTSDEVPHAGAATGASTGTPTSAPPSMRGRRRRSVPTQAAAPPANAG